MKTSSTAQLPHAVIFDFNGVIVSDERLHQLAWRKWCSVHGKNFTEAEFRSHVFGHTEADVFAQVFGRDLSEVEVAKYSAERVQYVKELMANDIPVVPHLFTFLNFLKELKIRRAIASSSRKPYLFSILQQLGIENDFEVIVTAEDVTQGKPAPDVYLRVLEKLQVSAHQAFAIEDSVSGIIAAHAAGLKVAGITTTHTAEEIKAADKIIENFSELCHEVDLRF